MSTESRIQLYSSLTRKKEPFEPLAPGTVGLYTCGPTVYNFPHIGNMRAYIIWDVLKRFLQTQNFEVTHIMNVTDVGHLTSDADEGEDKLEIARKRERMTARQVADKYFEYFKEDVEKLNIIPPAHYVKATDCIADQIEFAKLLDAKGYLYRTSDGMYFDTSKILDYGKLARMNIKGLLAGSRVAFNPEKKHSTDFAVWKFSPTGAQRDMEWESPWGKGFPGWHLECSTISRKYLGDTFDIHTGGIEHRMIHHPNEMAQSFAVTGKPQARFWMHNNFINFKDKKMSKSAGTFVRLGDLFAGGVSPLAFRYFVMQTHYRKEIAYSWDAIKAAQRGLANLYKEISFYNEQGEEQLIDYKQKFFEALADDLNTAKALDIMQRMLGSQNPSSAKFRALLIMDEVLGLNFRLEWQRRRTLPHAAHAILESRQKARERKDWQAADEYRKQLLNQGVEVKDTSEGQQAALTE